MYSPRIDPEFIPRLYQLGQKLDKPMTELVNEAVATYLKKSEEARPRKKGAKNAQPTH